MSVLVAVADSSVGRAALPTAVQEAQLLGTDLVVLNLALHALDLSDVPGIRDVDLTVVDRSGPDDRDPAQAVLDEIDDRGDVQRLVIGLRRRSPVGKAVFGSVSQRLLLEAPVPVLAVKLPG